MLFGSRWDLAIQLLLPLVAALALLVTWFVILAGASQRERSVPRRPSTVSTSGRDA